VLGSNAWPWQRSRAVFALALASSAADVAITYLRGNKPYNTTVTIAAAVIIIRREHQH
jgi:hypothetical protein